MRSKIWLFALVTMLAGCKNAQLQPVQISRWSVVLPTSEIGNMLHQCSRDTPQKGEGGWQPNANNIAELEARLPDVLREQKENYDLDWSRVLSLEKRQYVGVVRNGKRYVYGNFFPEDESSDWLDHAISVCDGGGAYFGALYDLQSGKFELSFNGVG